MDLSGLQLLLQGIPAYRNLARNPRGQRITVLDAAKPFLLSALFRDLKAPVLVITPGAEVARKLHEELTAWCSPGAPVYLFPQIDVLPYERVAPDFSVVHQRLRVLAALSRRDGPVPLIVAPVQAVARKTLPVTAFASQLVKAGEELDLNRLMARLVGLGYELNEAVEMPGSISKRGGIVDVYSPDHEYPARIEFLGNQAESIRWFDPTTQRSVGKAESLMIVPAREVILNGRDSLEKVLSSLDLSICSAPARDAIREDIELLRSRQWRDGLEFYAPLFNDSSVIDYLPGNALVILDNPENVAAEMADLESQSAELRQAQTERGELPGGFPLPYFGWADLQEKFAGLGQPLLLERWGHGDQEALINFGPATGYGGRLSHFLDDASHAFQGRCVVVVSEQANRLNELLNEHRVLASVVEGVDELPPPGSLTLVKGSLYDGWTLGDTSVLTDTQLFGFAKKRRTAAKRPTQQELFLGDLVVDEYVVHIDHGIARFAGVVKMSSGGVEREYLLLEYAEGDKVYVPSDQVDRVGRYIGPGGYVPSLTRLNTQEWERAKQKVKKAADEIAADLLTIYAAREISARTPFSPDTLWQQELEASFPYVETPDQLEAIREIKQDMEGPKPMDRLICGDVGYGKTEVALRAAFKAVMEGRQVAVLVPTTILAQQHFRTFSERLAAFPVRVDTISRFRTPKEQQAVLRGLADHSIDICVGTHRLLQGDVVFRDLGLVIIDEEQKFGVAHKERLRRLRAEVDVLALSATPIPRTLHMSLIGMRDMSTIVTPPQERLPVKTYVTEYNDEIVREAIQRELGRKGQVFFLHNRVQSIEFVAREVAELVPEARIAVAHGQMPEEELESTMLDFTARKIDVLICTTIVESGLDLPNANTLIVNHADKLGLTQMYHLRGRVGRGDIRAYAYFLYEKGKRLTDPAEKRLKTIFNASELGSGFQIAMTDLEIRGAGNILGAEQSGHMEAVGFDLYCRLLSEAVEEMKSGEKEKTPKMIGPAVDLPLTAHIPEDYIPDMSQRLGFYRRLGGIDSLEQLKDLKQELEDRFGAAPEPVQNLLLGIRIKLLGAAAGIQKVLTEGEQIVITVGNGAVRNIASLQRRFGSSIKVGSSQVRLDTRQLGKFWPRILEQVLQSLKKAAVAA